jgi:hypothetical protein
MSNDRIARLVAAYIQKEASEVTNTIIEQMGGAGRLQMMLGRRPSVVDSKTVGISWPSRQRSRGNYLEIAYNEGMDTYKMTFYNNSAAGSKVVKVLNDVYWDQLKSIFENQTGWVL